jgi:IclR family acetate operon transcriptional repressor
LDGEAHGADARYNNVRSLLRALKILNLLAEAHGPMSLTTIAAALELAPSTAHRLLTTLEQERYVRFDVDRRTWSIGVQTFLAGRAFLKSRDLVSVSHPHMRVVMEECRTNVNLAVQEQAEVTFIHQLQHSAGMRVFTNPGRRVPLYCSAVGKAMLAGVRDGELDRLLPRGEARRMTVNTLVSRSALREDIELTRERGFAIDDEEHEIGLRCVAAPVYDENCDVLAAISVSGSSARISHADIERFGQLLRRKAADITINLGGTVPVAFRRT